MYNYDIPFHLQVTADVFHIVAILFTIYHLTAKKSAQGISLKTQALYLLVFATRYLDVVAGQFYSWYNTMGKLFFVSTALLIVVMMKINNSRNTQTDSHNTDTYNIGRLIYPALIFAFVFNYASSFTCVIFTSQFSCLGPIDSYRAIFMVMEVLWSFSRFLEPLVLVPQIHMLRHERSLRIDSGAAKFTFRYAFLLALYVSFYIAKQIYHRVAWQLFDPISSTTRMLHLAICVVAIVESCKSIPSAITLGDDMPEEQLTDGEKAALLVQDNVGNLTV